jgi:hypothetical protein
LLVDQLTRLRGETHLVLVADSSTYRTTYGSSYQGSEETAGDGLQAATGGSATTSSPEQGNANDGM